MVNRGHGTAGPRNSDAVHVTNISYSYNDYQAVDSVSFRVPRGEVFGLLGTNGAGKTTTLEIIQGLRRPQSGSASIYGLDIRRNLAVVRRHTGVMLQEAGHYEFTVQDALRSWQRLSSRTDTIDSVVSTVGLDARQHQQISTLSGGERRRLDLALAIWGRPELLILDEPTTGLDVESRITLWDVLRNLREQGTSILLTTHYLEEIEQLADRVAIMHSGRIAVHGTLDDVLLSRPSRLSAVVPSDSRLEELVAACPPYASLEVDRAPVAGREQTRLLITSHEQQLSLAWLMDEASERGVPLQLIRASPASLEEVFRDITSGDDLEGSDNRTTVEALS